MTLNMNERCAATIVAVIITLIVMFFYTHDSPNFQFMHLSDDRKTSSKSAIIQALSESLDQHLMDAASTPEMDVSFQTCKEHNVTNYDDTCRGKKNHCLKTHIPEDSNERIDRLVNLKTMTIPGRYFDILQSMRDKVKTKQEVVILHALSSNHFRESQGLMRNLHEVVFPTLRNFTFIVYDLGLRRKERSQLKKHCRCTVISFPFSEFPTFFKTLNCFSWKVFIIAAHYEQAAITIWTDASIRIHNASAIPLMIERTKSRGVQQSCGWEPPSPYRTLPQLYESFGDSPCAHLSFRQCEGNWGMYHREPLIRRALIQPWLTCASNPFCICPVDNGKVISCPRINPQKVGLCHRHDQSAVTTILAKLFRQNFDHFAIEVGWFQKVKRGQTDNYFEALEKK